MDVVLGLALTSTAVRWVLVEGATGEGAPIDRGQFQVDGLDADFLLDLLLNKDVVAEGRLHAVGVTWTNEAAVPAGAVLDALAERGLRNVVAVSDNDAAAALASGVADITGHDAIAVCVIEPDSALVALVTTDAVTVDRIERPLDRADALELTSSVIALLDVDDRRPETIFVVGSDDVDVIVSSFGAISETPVFSASEADLALARGAALASARDVNAGQGRRRTARPEPGVEDPRVVGGAWYGRADLRRARCRSLCTSTCPMMRRPCSPSIPTPPKRPRRRRRAPRYRHVSQRPLSVPEVAKTIVVRGAATRRRAAGRGARGRTRRRAAAGLSPSRARVRPARTGLRATPGLRTAEQSAGLSTTAASRSDPRAHPDHQPFPRAAVPRVVTAGSRAPSGDTSHTTYIAYTYKFWRTVVIGSR